MYIVNVFETYLTENNISRPLILFLDGNVLYMTMQTIMTTILIMT